MEARKITVVQTKNQRKSVIMSSATTLAELKHDLDANGIDYDGMTFFEGTSKVELKTDDSVLPHDVPFRGQTTNELVFMLTNTNKKIRSGAMSRTEAYQAVKVNNLQDTVKEVLGKNYTMCKTADLISIVQRYTTPQSPSMACETPAAPEGTPCGCVDKEARKAIMVLAECLNTYNCIDSEDYEEVAEILGSDVEKTPKTASPYSDDEINDMFADMDLN